MADGIVLRDVTVTSEGGRRDPAKLMECSCKSTAFHGFQVTGQTHIHLQCTTCAKSYCPGNQCNRSDA